MKRQTFILLLLMMTTTLTAQNPAAPVAPDFSFDEMTYAPEATTFRLFAPEATAFKQFTPEATTPRVRIYQEGIGGRALKTVKMTYADGLWTATVKGDLKGRFYTFDIGRGETPGVFAKAVGVNGRRGAIIDLADTDPAGWAADERPVVKSPADLVIYELHHRDFSIARNINLHPEDPVKVKRQATEYPGKFLALTEPWAIGHLKALGVNAIHILPSYDFGSVDETRLDEPQYNWGYDPVNYNVPEGSYSTNPYDPTVRIREFKQMVQALHKAGIRVILDVVYNHTYNIDGSNFQRTYPDYYYRTLNVQPSTFNVQPSTFNVQRSTFNVQYSNGSGCGNETASDREMMRRFMIESVRHWIREYHIDGLRFDLMGVHDIETMNQIRRAVDDIDPTIFIYGEGWSAGQCALPTEQLAVKANIPQMPGIAAFSDELRDALRGPFSDDTVCGWLGLTTTKTTAADGGTTIATGDKEKLSKLSELSSQEQAELSSLTESLKFGIVGGIAHPQVDMTKVNYSKQPWALEPTQFISYVSCHDDMCLTDRLRASVKGLTADELIRLDLLAQTAVFTSQGVPFMLSGEELLRDKKGVHNSFESPDSINQLDWSAPHRYPQVLAYYQNLIALRKHHPAFRLGSADLVRKHLEFLDAPQQVVAFRLKNYAGRDDWRNIIVILNANRECQEVPIPEGTYTEVCCDGVIDERGLSKLIGYSATVPPLSALIIHD